MQLEPMQIHMYVPVTKLKLVPMKRTGIISSIVLVLPTFVSLQLLHPSSVFSSSPPRSRILPRGAAISSTIIPLIIVCYCLSFYTAAAVQTNQTTINSSWSLMACRRELRRRRLSMR
eukprot:scaffold248356_cov60-Cyclotella_meneghiniana.AAC.4